MARAVVNPDTVNGTALFEVVGGGEPKPIGFSTSWNIRQNPEGSKCPSSIDEIVVASTFGEANTSGLAVGLIQKPGVASSSFSSSNVTAIKVQPDGSQTRTPVNYLLVTKWEQPAGAPFPIANEIWFSQEPFTDQAAVEAAERSCAGEARHIVS